MAGSPVPESRISQLAEKISNGTASIGQYLAEHDLPFPSFEPGAPERFPEALEAIRLEVFEATHELGQLMLGAKEALYLKARDNVASLQAIASFRLAEAVPLNSEISYADVSQASGLNEPDVRRIMRHAATDYVFKEPRKGFVSHTAASSALVEDPKIVDYIDMTYGEVYPAACQTVNAMKKWPNSESSSQNGFTLATGGETMFSYLDENSKRAHIFANAMSTFSTGPGWEVNHVLEAFDWSSIGDGTIVDIGGSTGYVVAAICERFPQPRCIVQDLPSTIAKRPALPSHLDGRIEFMIHDFFTEQPVKGAAVYFFRLVFHNWTDTEAVGILRQLVLALKPGSHVLLSEWCLPEPNTVPWLEEKKLRSMDMNMLSLFNSRERDRDDWNQIFSRADKRFVVNGVMKPEGSNLSFIDAVWEPSQ